MTILYFLRSPVSGLNTAHLSLLGLLFRWGMGNKNTLSTQYKHYKGKMLAAPGKEEYATVDLCGRTLSFLSLACLGRTHSAS